MGQTEAVEQRIAAEVEAVAKLPVERLTRRAFDSLLEYSCTRPTGVFVGKVWKRDLLVGFHGKEIKPLWVLCEYVASGPDKCRIEYRRPEIIGEMGKDVGQ